MFKNVYMQKSGGEVFVSFKLVVSEHHSFIHSFMPMFE